MEGAVFVCAASSFERQFLLAKRLKSAGMKLTFVFSYRYPGQEAHISVAKIDFSVISLNEQTGLMQRFSNSQLERMERLLLKAIRRIALGGEILDLIDASRLLRSLTKPVRPEFAVLDLDNRYMHTYYSRRLSGKGIRVLVAPGWFANEKELVFSNQYQKIGALGKRILALLKINRAIHSSQHGETLIPLRISVLIFRELLGYLPPRPWTLHSGFAHTILCESEAHRYLGEKYGLEKSILIVAGSAPLLVLKDELEKARQDMNKMPKSHSTAGSQRQVLVAIPYQLVPQNPRSRANDYQSILMKFIELQEHFPNVEFKWNLHPSLQILKTHLPDIHGHQPSISSNSILHDLARSSALIACGSSVIAWGLALGLPVVNWDVFEMDYDDYRGSKVVYTTDFDGLEHAVQLALSSQQKKEVRPAWKIPTRDRDATWGDFSRRIDQTIIELLSNPVTQ